MARTPRRATDSRWHHVFNRGARSLPIFGREEDRLRFLASLDDAATKCDARIHAYALMVNHFHLLVHAEVGQLSELMRRSVSDYTRAFNHAYGFDGALLRGRFRSVPVHDDRQLKTVVRYIHRNPIHGLEHPATLSDFRWTSHLAYLGVVERPRFLHLDLFDRLFDRDRTSLREFIEGSDVDDSCVDIDASTGPGPVRQIGAREIERALGVDSALEYELLRDGRRGPRSAHRAAVALLCRTLTSLSSGDIAERYGFSSAAAVRQTIRRARARVDTDPAFARLVHDARQRLDARHDTGDVTGV